jgi:quercetin dioxygenase-like cupin family protein
MSKVIPLSDLPTSATAHEFEGFAFGSDVSFILVDSQPGAGPSLHRHPYSETFIVIEGNVLFQLGEEEIRASAGSVVVVPANTPHRFTNPGPGRLFQVDIHASKQFVTEWLDRSE